ncbi:multidrug efflux pump subunit AcrB [Bradyrhizobium sp. USDA 3397]
MKVAYDSTTSIQSSIDEVEKTLIEAIAVVVVIFLFLASLRSVIIPVVTIPLSLIGVCSMMLALGFSFNLLTLLARYSRSVSLSKTRLWWWRTFIAI